jgi:hypothetical protein
LVCASTLRWRWWVPLKHRALSELHSVITLKTVSSI